MDNQEIIVSDEAYKYNGGPVLLLAGPGTGKTWQLAQRIKFLTSDKKAAADEITVITFTREAAKGMRAKLEEKGSNEYIEPDNRPSRISTMHSLGHQILFENPTKVGLKDDFYVVEDSRIREPIMRDAAILLGYTEKDAKEAFRDRAVANVQTSEKSKQIVQKYEEILRACNSIDYDDQINLACKLLKENEEILKKYSQNSKYLLVDEYQDINQGQYELIELLSRGNRTGLFVVGDDDQSIYSFRGGTPIFIRNFKNNFGDSSAIIQMRTSRRCPANVLECANSIVAKFDSQRLQKGNYIYKKSDPGKVVVHDCPSDDREAEIIGAILKGDSESLELCDQCKRLPKRTYFILVPNKNYSHKIQQKLKHFGIPFDSKFGETNKGFSPFVLIQDWVKKSSSFQTRQIIELLIEGGAIENLPNSKVRLKQKIDVRTKGLKDIASLWCKVITDHKTFLEVLIEEVKNNAIVKGISEKLQELKLSYEKGKVPDFLQKVSSYTKPWSSIDNFFDDISIETVRSSGHGPHVRILTLQSSKGLQANLVFIIGMEEDAIPRKASSDEALAEEARLFFVGMTRAEDQLHLFKCRKRTSAASYKPIPNEVKQSRFLEHFPDDKHEKQFHQPKGKIKKKK